MFDRMFSLYKSLSMRQRVLKGVFMAVNISKDSLHPFGYDIVIKPGSTFHELEGRLVIEKPSRPPLLVKMRQLLQIVSVSHLC